MTAERASAGATLTNPRPPKVKNTPRQGSQSVRRFINIHSDSTASSIKVCSRLHVSKKDRKKSDMNGLVYFILEVMFFIFVANGEKLSFSAQV